MNIINGVNKMSSNYEFIYKIEDITKTFKTDSDTITALDKVSFDVKEGELVVVVGPSGCGKSTLLRILAHLIKPTDGKVNFKGDVGSKRDESKVGFVFQESALMPWRTVIDNIILPIEIGWKETKSEMYKKAKKLLKLLNLEGFEKYYPAELSGGMSQRVAIARALISDPPVLLMDEPFSALDELIRQKLNFELLRLKKKTNKTIVFVTHNVMEAVILADKIIVMGLDPNTIIGRKRINLPERTPKLLTNPLFFRRVEEIREIIDHGDKSNGGKHEKKE
jgi:NitT/TauT family transport system ATP-binding protein